MKIRNRIMSWILSPGAYAVWHALGAPKEWEIGSDDLTHKATGLRVTVLNWREAPAHGLPRPIAWVITIAFSGFVFDCEGDYCGAIGPLERHLVAYRGYAVMARLHRGKNVSRRKQLNREVFVKMCLPINKEVS